MSSDLTILAAIRTAIFHGARAGGCRKAARVDRESAAVWLDVAGVESAKASAALSRLPPPADRVNA